MEKLREFLVKNDFPLDLQLDGKMHRFDREGELSGWFHGHTASIGDKTVTVAKGGDWKSGLKLEFEEAAESLSETEAAELLLVRREHEKKIQAAIKAGNLETARLSELLWEAAHGPNGHTSEYLRRKKLDGFFGAKTITTDELREHLLRVELREVPLPSGHINLLVPCRDENGKLWGIQTIRPDGHKNMKPGQRGHGIYHPLLSLEGEPTIYLCEGFATAASVQMAMGKPAVCAFNAGNIGKVAELLVKKYPEARIIIAGDDDKHTVLKDGTKPNAGREKAEEAAAKLSIRCVFPRFASEDGKPNDWNDLHVREGLEAVRNQLTAFDMRPAGELVPLSGKMEKPKLQKAATQLLNIFADRIRKREKDLFLYTGTHWKNLTVDDTDQVKMKLQILLGQQADAAQVESAYRLLLIHTPPVPAEVDPFCPPRLCANFMNGTLHVDKTPGGNYALKFRAHDMNDWVINTLPYNYQPDLYAPNLEFNAMLERIFHADPDAPGKLRALRQMYGACLLPAFPQLFMLHGKPGTGKSTAILLAAKLAHKDNTCSVDPTEWSEFNMETMAGKLVNYDTDIEMNKPITDRMIKKVDDRSKIRIRRKGVKDIYAPLPATHLFGGNGIPKTLDGVSRAHDRRWTFLEFLAVVTKGQYAKDYVDYCFNQGPEGILAFALEGLKDLLEQKGHFSNPESGKRAMEKWQLRTDPVGRFFAEMGEGQLDDENCRFIVAKEARLDRARTWVVFRDWLREGDTFPDRMGRTAFFDRVRAMGFVDKRTKTGWIFEGFGVGVGDTPSG